jgi:hypothetical protein
MELNNQGTYMKTSLLLAVMALVAGFATSPASLAEVQVDFIGKPAVVRCPSPAGQEIRGVHMDKIIFRITGNLAAPDPAVQVQLNLIPKNSRLDIKVLDDPRTIADLKGKVLTFMGAPNSTFNRAQIEIDDVEYAVVCGEAVTP